jgi:hypothetical protein
VKRLISIGVVLALMALVVVPGAVAAQCSYGDPPITPSTYAKVPFTIVGTGFYLMGDILAALGDLLPDTISFLPDLMQPIGDWAMGPLAWSVDMLGWGIGVGATLIGGLSDVLDAMGIDLGGMDFGPVGDWLNTIACSVFQPFNCNVTGAVFEPCG